MIAAKLPGRIVNIASSSACFYAGNGAALYSISKAAVVRMSEVLAVEWAKFNINVKRSRQARFRPR
ncbi:SDR family NAD(P)-dependent oxidoreductase [Bradyrhizobium canariense]|uniref:SDR family NAD(P)-dependent oxidoreductase n=1 Tax=Bradyrhizobium TaxID=374 RepID=UPI0018E9316D|nr:SDR family NAD(P)-dependent oxidoreductase [Bradyrhizobium canariense]